MIIYPRIYIVSQKKLVLLKWSQARRSYFFWDTVYIHTLDSLAFDRDDLILRLVKARCIERLFSNFKDNVLQ